MKIAFFLASLVFAANACDDSPTSLMRSKLCQSGIASGDVGDNQLSASSTWGANEASLKDHAPKNARLNKPIDGDNAGWSAATNDANQYITVNFERTTRVTGVITQGRGERYNQWVTKYKVALSHDGTAFSNVQENGVDKVFDGNVDMESWAVNFFPQVAYARYVRIIPTAWNNHISMRFEVITC